MDDKAINAAAELIKQEIKREVLSVLLKQYIKSLVSECGGPSALIKVIRVQTA